MPTVRLYHLSAEERRAYVLADNKLALNAGWDQELLAPELQTLIDLDFDIEVTGFSTAEIDLVLDAAKDAKTEHIDEPEDQVPALATRAFSRLGDLWYCGRHRLLCGNAIEAASYRKLLDREPVDLIFTDPPYNVPIDGHVSGLGRIRHREFAMATGEMSEEAFTAFLRQSLGTAADTCRDGAIAFVCMDWRHMGELLAAGQEVFSELKNLCVWNKTNGDMGTFYRSKHELVFVFKVGTAPHVNNFGLGETGRYRTNVWDYPGISSISASRQDELAMHPTVKPVALIADALRDCSKRGDLVLDPFGGSGSTLIAAEKVGRAARRNLPKFRKGRSGNPRGRPRKTPKPSHDTQLQSLDDTILREWHRPISIRENGEPVDITAGEAVIRATINNAIKGDLLAAEFLLRWKDIADERQAAQKSKELEWQVDKYVRLERLKREGEQTLQYYADLGLSPPRLLPHPDDIILIPSLAKAWVAGPETPEDEAFYDYSCRFRDFLYLNAIEAEHRHNAQSLDQKKTSQAMLLAHTIDLHHPKRYRIKQDDLVSLLMRYELMSSRERQDLICREQEYLCHNRPPLQLSAQLQDKANIILSELTHEDFNIWSMMPDKSF